MEDFGKELIDFLLERHQQMSDVHVDIERKSWSHIITSNNVRHPTAFVQGSSEVQLATIKRSRHGNFSLKVGLKDLKVMKTAQSSFAQFYKDSLTTLADSADRLFGTAIQVYWEYDPRSTIDYDKTREHIRDIMLDIFSEHKSASVQHTLYTIGKHILDNVPTIDNIHFTMPNSHCIPVDLTRFGEENKNEIFTPTDDPHGLIQCELKRPPKDPLLSKL